MELLSAPYFEMYNNASNKTDIRPGKDMTNHTNNQIVLVKEFMFEEKYHTAKNDKFTHHTMIHEIFLPRRLGWRILRKHFGYAENVNTIS